MFPIVCPIDSVMNYFTNMNGCGRGMIRYAVSDQKNKDNNLSDKYKHKSKPIPMNVFKTSENFVIHNTSFKSMIG